MWWQSLVLRKCAHLSGHQLSEGRMKVCDRVQKINKLTEDENKGKGLKSAVRNFDPQFQKGALEEFPEEIAFATEMISEK